MIPLANQFVGNGWRLKPLHKLIMTSAAYRQATALDPESWKADPGDEFYWRYAPKRLEAEAIRDSILQASGTLNLAMYGPGVKPRVDPGIIATQGKTAPAARRGPSLHPVGRLANAGEAG